MKKIIAITILFFGVIQTYSQTDSLLLKFYEQKILENSKLNIELQNEKQNFINLSVAYKNDTLALHSQIKDLRKEVSSEKQKVLDLNKNKIKEERDNLYMKVDSLTIVVLQLNKTIAEKDKQIANEKAIAKTNADNSRIEGKAEATESVVVFYKSLPFDSLILSSTKHSISRDLSLVSNKHEVLLVLKDLQTYFIVQELLSQKFDAGQIKKAQTQLSQIKRQSKLLDALKEDIEDYQDFNFALKETISKLIILDERKLADRDSEIQKLKFNDIVTILADYIYNYYDYGKYTYLSDIVLEIIKRKKPNADQDITDLFLKL